MECRVQAMLYWKLQYCSYCIFKLQRISNSAFWLSLRTGSTNNFLPWLICSWAGISEEVHLQPHLVEHISCGARCNFSCRVASLWSSMSSLTSMKKFCLMTFHILPYPWPSYRLLCDDSCRDLDLSLSHRGTVQGSVPSPTQWHKERDRFPIGACDLTQTHSAVPLLFQFFFQAALSTWLVSASDLLVEHQSSNQSQNHLTDRHRLASCTGNGKGLPSAIMDWLL